MQGPRIYNLFPLLAGPVEAWTELLPRIRSMGFDWIFVNPFHYPGFSGSLYAVKDYYRLHPLLQADSTEPADALLQRFVHAAQQHGLRVMMDLVINHTAKDSLLADQHPEWFARDNHGNVRSPFAIDPADASKVTVWGDLAEIDYTPRPERNALINYWKDVMRHYARLGFSGFRCDAAYKIPGDVWAELIGLRHELGDVTFFAETLGCRIEEMQQLAGAGFDYFFNSAKWWDFREPWLLEQYEAFRHVAPSIAFPESHDTERLGAELESKGMTNPDQIQATYRLRYLFSTFFSSGVMMPMGYEHGYRRKLNVVSTRPEDREQPRFDLTAYVAACNRIKATLGPLNEEGMQTRIPLVHEPLVGLLRRSRDGSRWTVGLVNPDAQHAHQVHADVLLDAAGATTSALCERTPETDPALVARGQLIVVPPLTMRVFDPGIG